MYFKVILLTVTLFLYCFPSSDALSCLFCNTNSTACLSGKDIEYKTCVGAEFDDKQCISYLMPGRTVLRDCHITSGVTDICMAQMETFPSNKHCKSCPDNNCNKFDYSNVH